MASKSLGTLTLDLVAKTAGFTAGMSKAEKATEKWRKKAVADAKVAGAAIGKAFAFGAVAASAGLAAIIRNSVESENALSQLNATLKSTGGAAGKTAEDITSAATELQKITAYGDEAIIGMQSLLLTFKEIKGDNFDRTTSAVLDLSTALNQDLKSSALQVGKALNDPIKGISSLSRAGIQFTESQKETIKTLAETGRVAEAQVLILKELESQFGGSAAAAADTFSGSLKQVSNAFGDLLENPAGLQANKKALQDLAAFLSDPATIASAQKLSTAIVTSFTAATKAIQGTIEVTQFLGEALAAAAGGAAVDDAGRAIFRIAELEKRISALRSVENPSDNQVGRLEKLEDELYNLSRAYELNLELSKNLADVPPPKPPAPIDPPSAAGSLTPEQIAANNAAAKEAERQAKAIADAAKKSAQAIRDQISALQFQAETVGKTSDEIKLLELALDGASPAQLKLADAALKTVDAYEKNTKAQEDYQDLLKTLRTDEEVLSDQLSERLELLKQIAQVPGQEPISDETKRRVVAAGFSEAPEFSGIAPEVGGALGESFKIDDAQKELEEWYATQLGMLEKYRTEHAGLTEEYNEQEAALAQEHADRLTKIDRARGLVALSALEETFGALSGLAKQFAGEQSDAYRVLFAAEKAAAIARSIVAIQVALAEASAAPFPGNIAAMATVAAQTASIVSTISSVAIGQAHDGLMSVPKTGTYLLEKGERVTTANTSAKLDKTLEETKKSQSRAPTNLRIVNQFDSDEVVGNYMGSSAAEEKVMNIVRKNQRTIRSLSI